MGGGVAGSSSSNITGGGNASVTDDWGVWGSDAGAGGGSSDAGASETTVELEGLPPPPAGVTFQSALSKGADFSVLAGGEGGREREKELMTVLKTRAKCYKEAGEMKKAVADCTKVRHRAAMHRCIALHCGCMCHLLPFMLWTCRATATVGRTHTCGLV